MAARINHFTCCRSSPWLLRNRTTNDAMQAATTTMNATANTCRATSKSGIKERIV